MDPEAKATKPFAEAELIKKCAVEMAAEVLSHDEKNKKGVVELLKQVPLSANTATRRVGVFFLSIHQFEESRSHITSHRFVL